MTEVETYFDKSADCEVLDWAKTQSDLVEAWRNCPNIMWMTKFHVFPPSNDNRNDVWWRLAMCDSIRAEIWEYLYANEAGVIGGQSKAEKENFSLGDHPSLWCVPSKARRLVLEIEKYCVPHYRKHTGMLAQYETIDFRKDIVDKFETWKLFSIPRWNVYHLACNACQYAGMYYLSVQAFDCIQQAVGLMAVMNANGLTPRVDEEYDSHENPIYQKAKDACSFRQTQIVRARFGNPFIHRVKK